MQSKRRIYDPITKKYVRRKGMRQKMGGPTISKMPKGARKMVKGPDGVYR